MTRPSRTFDSFFSGQSRRFLLRGLELALAEDGEDLTSRAVFGPEDRCSAELVAKERAVAAGLPLVPLVLDMVQPGAGRGVRLLAREGEELAPGAVVATLDCPTLALLKAERVFLNLVCRLSGIATLTARYVRELEGARTRLLDTRKTTPGLRHAEKYAVLCGGGENHRMDLEEMLMLKDNHIDHAGGIAPAVAALRRAYAPCPPVVAECRTDAEVREAVAAGADRILLDNMDAEGLRRALALIPEGVASEASGGVSLENIRQIALLGPDYISVGRLTHSAPAADFSLRMAKPRPTR
ncbi:MAG: carboxylating nicotinate-nucleotide diphosphorylase [Thermodesulfobacteriota bacterium]